MEADCLLTFWKGFFLGGFVGFCVPVALLTIGCVIGGAKLNDRHERMCEMDYRENVKL